MARSAPWVPDGGRGPRARKVFTASAVIDGAVRGVGVDRTKKDAEQGAAAQAWRALQETPILGAAAD